MYYAGSTLHQKSQDDVSSQSSKRAYKKFQPRQTSQTSVNRKKFDFDPRNPKNLPLVKSKSKSKARDHDHSQISMPNLLITRNNSTALLRNNEQDDKMSEKSAPKHVRFTFGQTMEIPTTPSSQTQGDQSKNVPISTLEAYLSTISARNLSNEFRETQRYDGTSSRVSEDKAKNQRFLNEQLNQQLRQQIKRCRNVKNMYMQKLKEVRILHQDLTSYIQIAMETYNVQTRHLLNEFAARLKNEMKNFQTNLQTKMLTKINNETTRRVGQENTRSNNLSVTVQNASSPAATNPKLDHSNIMDKLDKIKLKLDQMTRAKDEFTQESTTSGNLDIEIDSSTRYRQPIFSTTSAYKQNTGIRMPQSKNI